MKTKALSYKSFFYGTIFIIIILAYCVFSSCAPMRVPSRSKAYVVLKSEHAFGDYWNYKCETLFTQKTVWFVAPESRVKLCDTAMVVLDKRGFAYLKTEKVFPGGFALSKVKTQ
jgi:hypothetical protein